MLALSFVLAGIGLTGIWLAGRKNLWGWALGFAAQPLWILFAVMTEAYGLILNSLGYATVYGLNWIKWRKENRAESLRNTRRVV